MKELGESIDHYQARITINLLDKNSKRTLHRSVLQIDF
jgi:hypothetical protein